MEDNGLSNKMLIVDRPKTIPVQFVFIWIDGFSEKIFKKSKQT